MRRARDELPDVHRPSITSYQGVRARPAVTVGRVLGPSDLLNDASPRPGQAWD
jgi:hypothetical protein